MKTQSRDTHPDAERIQIELLRSASVARRMSLVRSLSRSVIELARRGIARADSRLNEDEVALRFVELHYGRDLAERLRADLERRKQQAEQPSWP
jgi:hypothetical protein